MILLSHCLISLYDESFVGVTGGGGGTKVIGVQKAGQIVSELIDFEL